MANTNSIDLEASSSQYLSIADASQTGLDITGDNTFEFWSKLESQPATDSHFGIINKDNLTQRSYDLWYTDTSGTKQIKIFLTADNSVSNYNIITWNYTLSSGTWYHVAIVTDISNPSATKCELFINGLSQGNGTATTVGSGATSIYNSTAAFEIGRFTGSTGYFDGLIDDVRIWNDVRTAQEIADNYQKELVGNESGLVGYWKLNNSLLDETANNNDLTNNNSATFSTDVPFTGGYTLAVDTMAMALTFNAVTFKRALKFIADTMAMVLTFNAVLLKRALNLVVNTMSMSLTFNDVILSTANVYILAVDTMGMALTFADTTFKRGIRLIVASMSMALTFNAVTFVYVRAYTLVVDTMSLALTFFSVLFSSLTRWTNIAKSSTSFINKLK